MRLLLENRNIAALFGGLLSNQVSWGMNALFTPLFLDELGAGPTLIGITMGVPLFAQPLLILIAGSVAERVPPRRLMLATRVVVMLALVGALFSQTWWQLALSLFFFVSGALMNPAVSRSIADSTTERERAQAFTIVYAVGSSTALLLAPAAGGLVASGFGLRWIYLAGLLFQIISFLAFTRLRLPKTHHTMEAPATYRDALAYRPLVLVSLFLFGTMLVGFIGFALLPKFLHDVHDLSVGSIGQLGIIAAVSSTLVGLAGTRSRAARRPMDGVVVVMTLVVLSFVLFLLGASTWVFALAYLAGGCYWVSWAFVDGVVALSTPVRLRTRAFAFSEIFGSAGLALGTVLAGMTYDLAPRLPLLVGLLGTLVLLPAGYLIRGYVGRVRLPDTPAHGEVPAIAD
jgi:MFS family permease